MLSLATGHPYRLCDGISRRSFLHIGALTLGTSALPLADLLRAEAGAKRPHKAVINITLGGGPPHLDMWDLKPDAPAEIRGEFRPIATNLAGIRISEIFPRLARLMDRSVLIRSIVGAEPRHDTFQCLTGWKHDELSNLNGHPCIGAATARLRGSAAPGMPALVGLSRIGTWGRSGHPGFLGPQYRAFVPDGPALANMKLRSLQVARLKERTALARALDTLPRDLDARGQLQGMDAAERQALEVLTSPRLVEALDLSRECPKVLARYGDGKPYGRFILDGSPTANENLLLARRLVEAGVRCVTVPYGRWDSHLDNFSTSPCGRLI
jgi:hypothetical protein